MGKKEIEKAEEGGPKRRGYRSSRTGTKVRLSKEGGGSGRERYKAKDGGENLGKFGGYRH